VIPTRFKEKLPKLQSYPIGAEALSDGLANAPHADSFTVSFSGTPVWPDSRFQSVLAENHPYGILLASYEPAHKPGYIGANWMVERGWYGERWQIAVYPVLRELRHLANRLLREQGLVLVVEWLRSSEQAGWLVRQQRIELIFNPTEESIAAQKTSGV
jgi:hypothetical protein